MVLEILQRWDYLVKEEENQREVEENAQGNSYFSGFEQLLRAKVVLILMRKTKVRWFCN